MKTFLDKNFILENKTAERLYHDYAADMPIIDYHCHLPPDEIAKDKKYENLTKIWLNGDHYKWRALRANGVNEKYITGDASDYEKFEKWAETVPYTMRNPLYHWTHMELKNPFGVEKLLNKSTAKEIYDHCSGLLQTDAFSCKNLLKKFKVTTICTTDDPVDTLSHHKEIKESGFEVTVLPTFRADNVLGTNNIAGLNEYLDSLENVTGIEISGFYDLVEALKIRHDYFHQHGGRLSDHGLEHMYAEDYTDTEIKQIFSKIRNKITLSEEDQMKYKSAMLYELAVMDHEKGWAQQFHLGALRNNNTRMVSMIGPDTGYDSIGDFEMGISMSRFFNRLEKEQKLTKTIIYNLNPRDNYLFASMVGNFNDGSVPGKMQFGTGWWFLDQKEGMEWQMNALSTQGLLSRFIGMLTDSRSFLSYPRHDYFRRILCNLIGKDVENGLIPDDIEWLGQMVKDISYNNAKNYLNI